MAQLLKQPARLAAAARVLVETGIVRIERPDKALASARELLRWKMTPAAAFVVSAARYPDDMAIVDERGTLTFAEVHRRTNALARSLADEGIAEDDGVAIMCRDHRWFIEATVALSKLGATALFFNTAFAGPQLQEVTEREDPAGIAYDEEFAELVGEAAGDRRRWVGWHDGESAHDTTLEGLIDAATMPTSRSRTGRAVSCSSPPAAPARRKGPRGASPR